MSQVCRAHPTLQLKDLNRGVSDPLLTSAQIHYSYGGRGAIYQLAQALADHRGGSVLVPAFHCPTVVEPILQAGLKVSFYRVKRDLSIDHADLETKASRETVAILVINYCGFPAPIDAALRLRDKFGCFVIEDCAHSFLRWTPLMLSGARADMSVYSFYKLVPSYAGGGLRVHVPGFRLQQHAARLSPRHSLVILKRLLEQVIDNLDDGLFKRGLQAFEDKRVALKRRKLSSKHEDQGAAGVSEDPYVFHKELARSRMPWLSRMILRLSDLERSASLRRRNYRIIDEHLKERAVIKKVFPNLPDHVCPWAFPVLLDGRSKYDFALRQVGVPLFTFGERLHPLATELQDEDRVDAEYLSRNLMMLAVHQNLTELEVLNFTTQINKFFSQV